MGEFDTKRNGIPVKILETGEEFNSIKACADAIGGNASCVSRVVNIVLVMGSIFQKPVKNLKSARINEDVQELEYRLSKPEKRMSP